MQNISKGNTNMISIQIKDVKNFMSCLLMGSTFDFLYVTEISLTTFNTFTINGHLNQKYYTEDELTELNNTQFSSWKMLKPVCYNLIKGNKTPERFKITFCLGKDDYDKMIKNSGASLTAENITGLYVHFTYENGVLSGITATSLSIFTMDKTLDKYWDETIKNFLVKHFDIEVL